MSTEVENIIEDLMDKGLPENLTAEIEQLLIRERANAEEWKKKYQKEATELSWYKSPDPGGY